MALYKVDITVDPPKGTYTRVKNILVDLLGGNAGWDYGKPVFLFSADDDQIVLIASALGELGLPSSLVETAPKPEPDPETAPKPEPDPETAPKPEPDPETAPETVTEPDPETVLAPKGPSQAQLAAFRAEKGWTETQVNAAGLLAKYLYFKNLSE